VASHPILPGGGHPLWWQCLGSIGSGGVEEGSGSAESGGDGKGGVNEVWDRPSGGWFGHPYIFYFLIFIDLIFKIKLKKLIF
jgi:hypothetical protein